MSHFYEDTSEGVEPRHFVEMASRPELRPTRITDVRKWWREGRMVVPSVTTVLNSLNKHGLNNWKIDQHIAAAWRIHNIPHRSFDEYLSHVKTLTEQLMEVAPQAGTDFHDKLERYLLRDLPHDDPDYDLCDRALYEVVQKTGISQHDWDAEKRFTCGLGYGGCVDLSCDTWVIDYKTKREASKFKPGKMAYDEHRMQLAAYRVGLNVPEARCANVFICLEDGQIDFHEHSEDELQKGWRIFSHALAIWQEQNGYPLEQQKAA